MRKTAAVAALLLVLSATSVAAQISEVRVRIQGMFCEL